MAKLTWDELDRCEDAEEVARLLRVVGVKGHKGHFTKCPLAVATEWDVGVVNRFSRENPDTASEGENLTQAEMDFIDEFDYQDLHEDLALPPEEGEI